MEELNTPELNPLDSVDEKKEKSNIQLWNRINYSDGSPRVVLSENGQEIMMRLLRDAGSLNTEAVEIPIEAFREGGGDFLEYLFDTQDGDRIIQILKQAFSENDWKKHNIMLIHGPRRWPRAGGWSIKLENYKEDRWK